MLGELLNSLRFLPNIIIVMGGTGMIAALPVMVGYLALYGPPHETLRERRLFRESERCAVVYEGVREFRFFDEQCQIRYKGEWRNADDIEWIERPKWTRP